uniref:Cortexin 1 n=1 Tax=Salmo trutta TaxID=8032 RepID=A0A674E8X2_SALTR
CPNSVFYLHSKKQNKRISTGTALCFMGLLLLLLLFLIVRCIRIVLDPYNSMTATSWTNDHRDPLERGQFDYALV